MSASYIVFIWILNHILCYSSLRQTRGYHFRVSYFWPFFKILVTLSDRSFIFIPNRDEAVNFAIQKGLDASRSKVKYFKHNDVQHLEQLLEQQDLEDAKNPKLAATTRKFIIVEGIYFNTGEIVPLPALIVLKKKFKIRLFIDESVSFGVLGKTGKGVSEFFQVEISDIDLIMGTLENALGSIGGFCVGTSYVIEHQTLAGIGYLFSASLPPMLASGAFKALELLENNTEWMAKLAGKCQFAHRAFVNLPGMILQGRDISPVKHLRLADYKTLPRSQQSDLLTQLVIKARDQGLALVKSAYLEDQEIHCPYPSIRLTISLVRLTATSEASLP